LKLSVLIPIYNRTVSKLLNELSIQSVQYDENIEIICLDDGSDLYVQENQETAESLGIPYHYRKNRGRAKSRNELVQFANGEYLLFLDCDSGIIKSNFLNCYMEFIRQNIFDVIYGGRIYPKKPHGRSFVLHWKYGKLIEAAPLNRRLAAPYLTFMSNNFVVKKEIFQLYPMDENLKKYGYEDLLWALELKEKSIGILHINNPVLHEDLCSFDLFLSKSKSALSNLAYLKESNKLDTQDTPLLKAYAKLQQFQLLGLYRFFFRFSQPLIELQLRSHFPFLFLFSLWKLGVYSKILALKGNK